MTATQELDITAFWAMEQGVLVEYLTCTDVPVVWLDKTTTYRLYVQLRRELNHDGTPRHSIEDETQWTTHGVGTPEAFSAIRDSLATEAKVSFCNAVRRNADPLHSSAREWAREYHLSAYGLENNNLVHYQQQAAGSLRRLAEHRDALYDLDMTLKWVPQ